MMRTLLTAMAALLLLGGCAGEESGDERLPEAFQNAEQVDVTMGSALWSFSEECAEANQPGEVTGEVKVSVVDGSLRVAYTGCFPCEMYKQEAYVKAVDGGYEVLFLTPEMEYHNACGSETYTLRLTVGAGAVGDNVTIYSGTDADGEAVLKTEAAAVDDSVDCEGLRACDADTPCEDEGRTMDERGDDYTLGCISLPSCGGAFCIWDAEACMMECNESTCALAESYPMQPVCE